MDAIPTSGAPLAGGHLLTAISTSIVGILREHYGRGPMKAKTYVLDDIIVVVMRGSGFTPLEQTIMNSGEPDRVIAMREDFQRVMAEQYRQTIEDLTGRKAHVEPRRHDGDLLRARRTRRLRRSRGHRARTERLDAPAPTRLGSGVSPPGSARRPLSEATVWGRWITTTEASQRGHGLCSACSGVSACRWLVNLQRGQLAHLT